MAKYKLSVCAIFKNEAKYIQEWIEFHRMVGVEHFYLYNNDSTDDYLDKLKPYEDIVTLTNIPGASQQMPAYNNFVQNYAHETEWFAIIDLDEFIIPKEKTSIPECINEIVARAEAKSHIYGFSMDVIGGIELSWVYYGTSFHIDPPEGLILENYLNRIAIEDNDNWCKCIYYSKAVAAIDNPHFTHSFNPGYGFMLDENGDLAMNLGRSLSTKANYLYVNHYTTRSLSEHIYKLTGRGWADGLIITDEHRNRLLNQGQYQFNKVFDPTTLRYVPAIKSRLQSINKN